MIEGRGGLGLAQQPLLGGGIGSPVRRHEFDGDFPVEDLVEREIDHAHATGAEWPNDFVFGEPLIRRAGKHRS
jgi:hypothetical protein